MIINFIHFLNRDAFQFQFLDNDNLEENAILDIDLDKLDTSFEHSFFLILTGT